MKVEMWRPIAGYEKYYEISSHGNVRRLTSSRMLQKGEILKGSKNTDGYIRFMLFGDRFTKAKEHKAHVLVMENFGPPRPASDYRVAHWDGNPKNNHLENLRWATAKENNNDKIRHGRLNGAHPGKDHHNAVLSDDVVIEIRRIASLGKSIKSISEDFGIKYLTAYDAITGKTWKHIPLGST